MAFITASGTDAAFRPSWIARSFAAIGAFFIRYAEMRSRQDRIAALLRLSDEDLAARGLTRDGVIRHVFCDNFYL